MIKHLKDGLADSEYTILHKLLSDGGHHAPKDIAEGIDFHLDTIYQAMKRIPDLVEHTYDNVVLKSPYIAEQLVAVIEHAEDTVAKAVETSANSLSFAAEEIESSPLVKWLRAHHVDIERGDDGRLLIRMANVKTTHTDDIREILRKGLTVWTAAGRDRYHFKNAKVHVPEHRWYFEQALPS